MLENKPDFCWDDFKELSPAIASHVQWQAQRQRSTAWYVLQNEATGEHARFNATAHSIISRLDGKRTLEQILVDVNALAFAHCEPQVLIMLLVKLQRMSALEEFDFLAPTQLRQEHSEMSEKGRTKRLLNPLAIRLNLMDPDRFLARIAPLLSLLFSVNTLLIWSLVLAFAVLQMVTGWDAITTEFLTRTLRVQTLWWFAFLYPMMKLVHEFAHALCVKHWGGQVREVGVSLLLLIPVPYVDASDVHMGHSRKQRMILTAAGMGTELFIASVALLLWFWVDPGYLRDALFSVFIIGWLTTLLFNANPLLKFDGYYLLQDALDIPNLAARSSVWLTYLFKRHALGLTQLVKPSVSRSESRWLMVYGLGVMVYRPVLTITIIVFLWRAYPVLGIVLAASAFIHQWLWPLLKAGKWLFTSSDLHGQRARALSLAFCCACVLATLLLVPMPSTTRVQGIVTASEQSQVFSETAGVIDRVHVDPGATVNQGDILITLVNPSLFRDLQRIDSELTALDARHFSELQRNSANDSAASADHATTAAERERLIANKEELLRRNQALQITAKQAGIFAPQGNDLLPGSYIQQGQRIGYVVNGTDWTVRTLVPETRAAVLRAGVEDASVRLAQSINTVVPATVLRQTPAVTRQLPSAALSQYGGGTLVTDPFDKTHHLAVENLFEIELVLPSHTPVAGLGQRALVRLDHPAEALLSRLWRASRTIWLTRAQV